MESRDAELETKAFAEHRELVLAGRTQLSHAPPTFWSRASLGRGRAHLQRGSRRQAGVVLQRSKGKPVSLGALGGAGSQQGAPMEGRSFGGQTQPNPALRPAGFHTCWMQALLLVLGSWWVPGHWRGWAVVC